MKYDYVAYLEHIQRAVEKILPMIDAKEFANKFPQKNVHISGSHSYKQLYRDIPRSVLEPVIKKYEVDAVMFDYTLDDYYDFNDR